MGSCTPEVIPYTDKYEAAWDRFVMNESVNGTFLQTRRFLDYHPKDRFEEASVLIMMSGNILAVCPANYRQEQNGKVLYSHQGSTFGGLIISNKQYYSEKILEIIDVFDQYLIREGVVKSVLKITPELFARKSSAIIEYCLQNRGYRSYSELNTYIDLKALPDPVTDAFDRNKKRNIEKCEKYHLSFRQITEDDQVAGFYELLTINLDKYGLKPIHTLREILEFKNSRLCEEVKFYGVFREKELQAGGMMFRFWQTNVIHAQNLSADYHFQEYSPITYLYYKVIEQAKADGYDKLTWGISTEDHGTYLNQSLVRNKESYGSQYALNRTFYKEYPDNSNEKGKDE